MGTEHKTMQRSQFLDVMKGIGIFLMIFGHAITSANGNLYRREESFWQDPVYEFIYTFHMPLFILISGYLFYFSLRRSKEKIVKRRIVSLLPPLFTYNTYSYIGLVSFDAVNVSVFHLIRQYLTGFWFIQGILIVTIIIAFIHKFLKDNKIVYALVLMCLFFIPNNIFMFQTYRWSFIIVLFIVTYLLAETIQKIVLEGKYKIFCIISAIVFCICLPFYGYEHYIYTGGYNIVKPLLQVDIVQQLWIDIYRFLIGVSGSITFIGFIYVIYAMTKKSKIWGIWSYIGRYSLAMYGLQEFQFIIMYNSFEGQGQVNYLHNFIVSIGVTMVCAIIIEIVKKNKVLRRLHLGG